MYQENITALKKDAPIGVFDSGIGGLSGSRESMRQIPNEKIIYFGDTARMPYGSKSKETVTGFSKQIVRFLETFQVKTIVVACNTASAYALDELEKELDIPIIECADYMETSALGRAEWMRFYGLLFGVAPQADNLFAEVDSCYQRLKMRAQLSSTSFSVVSELKSGSAWYVPGGRSTIGRLFQDACGRYAFADDTHSGSVPLAFETVFDKAGDADVWLVKYNRDRDMSYADLEADYIGYTGFKAFKTRNVYGCNTAKVPFYEETPFRPDYLLSDLIQILHPEIGDLGGLRYFCRLKE